MNRQAGSRPGRRHLWLSAGLCVVLGVGTLTGFDAARTGTPDAASLRESGATAASTVGDDVSLSDRASFSLNPASPFGRLTSRRWAFGQSWKREVLAVVPNPNPSSEPQPDRQRPYDCAVSADGRKVYVGMLGAEGEPGTELAIYDVTSAREVGRIVLKPRNEAGPPASRPWRLRLHPDGRHLLVTSLYASFASVIDTRSDEVTAEIPLDFYCQDIAFDRSGRIAYIPNRYLDQLLVLDVPRTEPELIASMRVLGGLDEEAFRSGGAASPHALLARRCGTSGCHDQPRGGLVTTADWRETFGSLLSHVTPGDPEGSRLLQAVTRTQHGGYADRLPAFQGHAGGTVVFPSPGEDPDYLALSAWLARGGDGPGIPVSNRRSKPKVCLPTPDGRHLLVGNTGTQDISIVSAEHLQEVAGIRVGNVVNDLALFHSEESGRTLLFVTTLGAGFGVVSARDPWGGESWDPTVRAANFSLWRNPETARILPRREQQVLGPYDAVDGTLAGKFRDIQNDLIVIDLGALEIPDRVPQGGPTYLASPTRYEAHRAWVRYTSDSAESTVGDVKGDIGPELMRVVGSLPEQIEVVGDRLYVTMQGSSQVQEWRIDPSPADPADYLTPLRTFTVGHMPSGIAAGRPGTPSEGKLFVACHMSGSLWVIDTATGESAEAFLDPTRMTEPFPWTNAERGEMFVNTSLFSSDGDVSCVHCHFSHTGDGRAWGVSQAASQQFLDDNIRSGRLVVGGTVTMPQLRNLFRIQPFFVEGVISAFEARSMIMESAPSEDFSHATPAGRFDSVEAHYELAGIADVQSRTRTGDDLQASLEERRDELFRELSLRYFGKSSPMRDFQRFVGEWQIYEGRMLPNPYDPDSAAAARGKAVFEDPRVGCISCHPPPDFTNKSLTVSPNQAIPPVVNFTVRDGSFTLIGMNRLDFLNGYFRDLEPWDRGRTEEVEGHLTTLQLRGIWERPPVFLHHGMARTLREVVCTPGHPALGRFTYEPRSGPEPERPGLLEVGFNETDVYAAVLPRVRAQIRAGARIGIDTHGGTSHLTRLQVDDLVDFMNSIQ